MTNANKLIISTKGLKKKYDSFTAVTDLNFSVDNGEIFGLLGPNGAGKTTIILMLLGLTEPSSGTCRVFGHDPVKEPLEVKKLCGYLPERFGFYENLTAGGNLRYIANLNNLTGSKAENLIEESLREVGLNKQKNTKVSKFSRGMKQRLGIAQAFLKKPELVILDEPTQGIDPRGIDDILKLFQRLNREQGLTILFSSHNMQQVQETCTSFGIMSKGKLMKKGTVKSLEAEGANWTVDVEAHGLTDKIIQNLGTVEFVKQIHRDGNKIVIQCAKDVRAEISESLIQSGAQLTKIGLREHSLLEVYRKYSEDN